MAFYYQWTLPKSSILKIGKQSILFAKFKVKGKNNRINIGENCTLKNTIIEISGDNNLISLGNNVKAYEGLKILIESTNCEIKISDKTTIGSAKMQLAEKNTKISIGEDCMFSREITINTSDFHSIIDLKSNSRINPAKDVIIGNHVWIGNGCYLNKGVIIGDNSIVAARSVVPGKNYENNILLGGVPARLLKSEINWDRKIV